MSQLLSGSLTSSLIDKFQKNKLSSTLTIIIVILFYIQLNTLSDNLELNTKIVQLFTPNKKPDIFNLGKELNPDSIYKSIQCRKSIKMIVSTTLCLHDVNRDIHVSGSILRNGVWESHIIS